MKVEKWPPISHPSMDEGRKQLNSPDGGNSMHVLNQAQQKKFEEQAPGGVDMKNHQTDAGSVWIFCLKCNITLKLLFFI